MFLLTVMISQTNDAHVLWTFYYRLTCSYFIVTNFPVCFYSTAPVCSVSTSYCLADDFHMDPFYLFPVGTLSPRLGQH